MEEMMFNTTTKAYGMMKRPPPRPAATLTLREDSHPISKKPQHKIRIVHIFAPEIIKTDAANFRELVQRLTGKPAKRSPAAGNKKKVVARQDSVARTDADVDGYLSGLGDVDGFLQGLTDFPMLPLGSGSHMDHVIGELSTSCTNYLKS